jgi:hypothetical protein
MLNLCCYNVRYIISNAIYEQSILFSRHLLDLRAVWVEGVSTSRPVVRKIITVQIDTKIFFTIKSNARRVIYA